MLDAEALATMLAPIIADEVEKATAPLVARIAELEGRPAPEKGEKGDDGKSIDPASVEAMVAESVAKAVAALPAPKNGNDGVGTAGALIDREGHLILTLTNGETRDLGLVVGKDGEKGQDGRDGFGFDDLDVSVLDDDRTIELAFRRGDEEKAFTLKWPTPIDRGVWSEKAEYARGDAVTWGGSLWIAQKDTPTGKPDAPESGWRLSVKKGRDGKDAKNG